MIRHGISSWVLVWYCFMLQKKITFWELKNQSSITYITNLWSQTGSGHVIFNITKFYSTCKRKFRIFLFHSVNQIDISHYFSSKILRHIKEINYKTEYMVYNSLVLLCDTSYDNMGITLKVLKNCILRS